MLYQVFARMEDLYQLKKLSMNWKNFLAALTSQKCIFVVGPTASGKSAWALEQAKKYNGSIVNIDSIQFYKDLLVGSAAPTEDEKKQVPHYLYSYVEAPVEVTAGQFIRDFYQLLENNKDIQFPLFIVGGTGFYIQALEKGMFDVEPIPEEFRQKIEEELELKGAVELHTELLKHDPHSKIHVNDHYRLVRALEIIRFTGKTPSELKENQSVNKNEFPFPYIKVGFDFEKEFYVERVQKRTQAMVSGGIVEEVAAKIMQGHQGWSALQSVGYKETLEFLLSGQNKEWLIGAIQQSTMKLIKKQKTWFKRDGAILWSKQSEQLDQFLSTV